MIVSKSVTSSYRDMSDRVADNAATADCPHCRNPLGSAECFDSHTVQRAREHTVSYKCLVCEYRSRNRGRYRMLRHVRAHTGEKPFGCPYCSYTAAQDISIKMHIKRIHASESSSLFISGATEWRPLDHR